MELIKKQDEGKESKDAKQKKPYKAVSTVQPGQMTLTNTFSKNINKTYGFTEISVGSTNVPYSIVENDEFSSDLLLRH